MAGRFEGMSDLEWRLFEDVFPLNQSTRDSYTRCPGRTDITHLCVLPVYQCCVA
jgi:hypothetical protein